ncbi:MAG TPA: outer membrane beta-barrel protein [Kofleriaceae bacterium]|nr:outer membrane beta-barrel protein [Kofleriaceae bacterium]
MRRALALAVFAFALPSVAAARPFTAGVDLGLSHSEANDTAGTEPSTTLGVFARLGLTSRLAGQIELQRIRTDDTYGTGGDIKTATALLVVELGRSGRLVPTLMAGIGLDRATGYYMEKAHHLEGGFGLEYRADGGFTLGADVRMGGRTLDEETFYAYPEDARTDGYATLYAPSPLQAGEYRSARITLGVRF